jgi:HJR/Mrr/RecB family endonuclease
MEQMMPTLGLLIVISGLAITGLTMLVQRRKLRAAAAVMDSVGSSPARPKTFEEHVAERLRDVFVPGHALSDLNSPPDRLANDLTAASHRVPAEAPRVSELTLQLLRSLEWKRFELLITRYFAATGVRAEMTQIGADGGIDVKLWRDGEPTPYGLVQCKAWGSDLVGVALVRELRGVMAAENVGQGVFATTSDFSADARDFAAKNSIRTLNASDLLDCFRALPEPDRVRILAEVTAGDYTTPTCPQCDTKMIWKPSAKFFACPRYPRCRSKPIYPRAEAKT